MNTANISSLAEAKTNMNATTVKKTVQSIANDFSTYVNHNKKMQQKVDIGSTATQKDDTNSSYNQYAHKDIQTATDTNNISKEEMDTVKDALKDFKDKIEDLLKKELGVSNEQITAAMNALGMSTQDLLDPKMLSGLIAKLTQASDNMTLVMSDSYQEIMQSASELTSNLLNELGIDMKQLKTICNLMTQQNSNPKMQQEVQLPETAEATEKQDTNGAKTSPVQVEQKETADTTATATATKDASSLANAKETIASGDLNAKGSNAATETTAKAQVTQTNNQNVIQTAQNAANNQNLDQSNQEQSKSNNSNFAQQNATIMNAEKGKDEKISSDLLTPKNEESTVEQKPEHLSMTNFMKQSNVMYQTDSLQMTQFQQSAIDIQSLIEQINEQAKVFNFQDSTTMQMQLNPESLGKLFIQVTQKSGEITATIAATDERVKEQLQAQVINLKDSLNQQGIKVNAVEVTIASHEFEQNLEQNANLNQQTQDQSSGNASQQGGSNQNSNQSTRTLNLNYLSDEALQEIPEELVVKIMKDNGNQVDITV